MSKGTFGTVYKARHLDTNADVAVKVVVQTRFECYERKGKIMSEANILSKLDSPFIVRYMDCFMNIPPTYSDGEIWMVTEYCNAGSLSDLMKARATDGMTMSEECIREVCASIVLGLEYLHGVANVCHRDIKCDNVLLTSDGHVKLAGFGSSAVMTNTLKTVAGSSYWMAPEVIRESHYDGRANVWSK